MKLALTLSILEVVVSVLALVLVTPMLIKFVTSKDIWVVILIVGLWLYVFVSSVRSLITILKIRKNRKSQDHTTL